MVGREERGKNLYQRFNQSFFSTDTFGPSRHVDLLVECFLGCRELRCIMQSMSARDNIEIDSTCQGVKGPFVDRLQLFQTMYLHMGFPQGSCVLRNCISHLTNSVLSSIHSWIAMLKKHCAMRIRAGPR